MENNKLKAELIFLGYQEINLKSNTISLEKDNYKILDKYFISPNGDFYAVTVKVIVHKISDPMGEDYESYEYDFLNYRKVEL